LTREQCEKLIAAATFAERIGLPFNRHWTVHSERAGILPERGAGFVGRLLHLAGAAAKRAGGQFAAVYCRENGNGKGEHVHILMHMPTDFTLANKTRSWISTAGGAYRARVSRVTRIGGSLKRLDPASERYRVNADCVLAYLLKGADETAAAVLGLPICGEFGWIRGKRCGGTENIGRAAQGRWASR